MELSDSHYWKVVRFFYVIFALMLAIAVITRDKPTYNLRNDLVVGCYGTNNGPSISLNSDGMKILQGEFPRIGFHLEASKTGIDLVSHAPLEAEMTPDGYRFRIQKRGLATISPFYKVINGRAYPTFDTAGSDGFQMLSSDGAVLNYQSVDPVFCEETLP
ncbi:MAG TPA: hypothetical protein VIG90_10760 [Pedomonas sp.]|uniref:hypothetical protein n=1 Tax=Pedomonas sp. TaxID=2976421 RepID=UPI002F3E8C94